MEWWSLGLQITLQRIELIIFPGWSKRFKCEAREVRGAAAYAYVRLRSTNDPNEADEPFSPAWNYFRTTYQLF
jgi:hypothetical protein